ncbi:MAG TPA: FtsK/SpoIIIE domain-containing protein [Mycobacteriales bacterium]|nr:FtsK/SpoIIIE domain-containing protein [Mycobacteriales bacterium]
MKLKLAFERDTKERVDLVIEADATATIGDLVDEIVAADPRGGRPDGDAAALTLAISAPETEMYRPLEPSQQLDHSPICSGFDARLVPLGTAQARLHANAATLRVISGPDVGRQFNLRQGPNLLGRESDVEIALTDRHISRQHARIDVGRTIEIVDLNSANGLEIDGGVVARAALLPGQVVTIGESRLVVELPHDVAPASTDLDAQGGSVAFNRSPRVEPRYPLTEHRRPKVPAEIDDPPFPWLLMVAPILIGAAVFAFGGRHWTALIFIATSPMMLTANYLMTRVRSRHRMRAQIARFEKQLEILDGRLTAEEPVERRVRNEEFPTTSAVVSEATQLGSILWTRRPEHWPFLYLRLGTGRTISRNLVAAATEQDDGIPEYEEKLDEVIRRHRFIDGVPVVESLTRAGAIGVAGLTQAVNAAAQALLAQITCLHSPAEVVVTCIGGQQTAAEFEWLKWAPHTSAPLSPLTCDHLALGQAAANTLLAQLEGVVTARLAAEATTPRGPMATDLTSTSQGGTVGTEEQPVGLIPLPAIVLVIGADSPAAHSRVVQLAERCPEAGIFTIWLADRRTDLPAVCRTFVDMSEPQGDIGFVRHGMTLRGSTVENMSTDAATHMGRRLAAISDASAALLDQSDLPKSITMLSLLGSEYAKDAEAVADRWRENNSVHDRTGPPRPLRRASNLRALVGQGSTNAMHLDLRLHGPHALVGGTTGAGKSEFLQTWVLGMATEYSPDRVTFLFVDYKGGAAFAECVNLPHCVGLVTDLSPYLVRRALTSLKAELRRREDIFNRKRAKDILELEKRGDPDCPPSLVLVIDEFAALVGEVPEFVDGVVDIAQRGRSLGIHLIMATQRPAGVIRDNLRANTNLRIALRMADEADSEDVIGTREAASFDPSIPGRAVAKVGPGRLVPFQAAYSGGWTTDVPLVPPISIRELKFGAASEWEKPTSAEPVTDQGPTDLARMVRVISGASTAAGCQPPRRPWLTELASAYDLARLGPRTDAALILGIVDQPEKQDQAPAYFAPDVDGNLAIYGTSGSGKSVLLRTLAAGAGVTPRGGPVHVYGLDFAAGGLRMLEVLPHVGSVISGDDSERVLRLLRHIKSISEARARTFPTVNAANITDYRSLADKPDEPRILLLIDGFPAFRAEYETTGPKAVAYTTLQQLISEGRQLGIHVAFTADRPAGVPGSIAASVPKRVVLRLAEESMYYTLGVEADVLTPLSPPGRAILDGLEAQVAVLGGSANAADQYEALTRLAKSIEARAAIVAPPIEPMPTEIAQRALPASVDGRPVLGIGETDLLPVGFAAEGVFLLGGGPSSGRSNALAAMVNAVRRADPSTQCYYLGHPRSSLASRGDWEGAATTPQEVAELAVRLTEAADSAGATAPVLVVVESIADFQGTPAEQPIVALTKALRRTRSLLIAESETTTWNSSFPLFAEIKAARRGLLLQPDSIEGETILRTGFPRVSRSDFPPGRGFFVESGRIVRVQVPISDEADGGISTAPHG